MKESRLRINAGLAVAVVATLAVVPGVHAITMVTFADPAADGSTPLFQLDSTNNPSMFTGGWSGTGLTLETPGLPIPDLADATFSMTPLVATPVFQSPAISAWTLPQGTIQFFDSSSALVLQIDFDSAVLSIPFGFGANEFSGFSNVTFSGPSVPAGLTQEGFGFSFANPVAAGNVLSVTASFTSSAVPEPMTLLVLAMGLPVLLVRRRR